ncbi:hypothetical protein X777_09390 [Ooceraea biroi]|uniref:Odorant receptor n=1 Tax=Ooceraea biroi TaxID=2015173 RepID=A0A026X2Z3_OOCBI|nr:hypothetical protein X777_09390 [Ooceraea biroi]
MDFRNVNSLNIRLNMLSGNLLPMTDRGSSFSLLWKLYGVLVWLIELILAICLTLGSIYVSTQKLLEDSLICFAVGGEVIFTLLRLYSCQDLVCQLIRQMNDILCTADESMKNIVRETLEPVKVPLMFYIVASLGAIIGWWGLPFIAILNKNVYCYEDYRVPVAFSKQPFSFGTFVLGDLFVLISTTYMFLKKVGADVYMIHLVLMMTAQYRYIAVKMAIFHEEEEHSDISTQNKYSSKTNRKKKKEIIALCRHYNALIDATCLLKRILSTNFSIIYVYSVFRFCFIGILISTIPSSTFLQGISVTFYAVGAAVQLYVLCSCVQQLLNASTEITDKAFHEEWYLVEISLKRTFMTIIMANNLECKLAKIENFNLSLPSYMTILNQSYSIALLFLRMK